MKRIFCKLCHDVTVHMSILQLWKCMKCGEYNKSEDQKLSNWKRVDQIMTKVKCIKCQKEEEVNNELAYLIHYCDECWENDKLQDLINEQNETL